MAKNVVFTNPDSLTLPVASGVVTGEVVKVGNIVGIAATSRSAAGTATIQFGDVVEVAVAAANYGIGDPIYGHASGGGAITGRVELIDKTSTTGTLLGAATEAKNLGAPGTLRIKLTQV